MKTIEITENGEFPLSLQVIIGVIFDLDGAAEEPPFGSRAYWSSLSEDEIDALKTSLCIVVLKKGPNAFRNLFPPGYVS